MDSPEPQDISAFPVSTIDGFTYHGMTLRDHFAGLAMQSLLIPMTQMGAATGARDETILKDIATMAYEMADAMMERRAQP